MLNNLISQAGTMGNHPNPDVKKFVHLSFLLELHGFPNDLLGNIDALTIVVFIPVANSTLYPLLHRSGIPFRPITRITVGFIIAALAMLYAAGVQHLIYTSVFQNPLSLTLLTY
jgi:POT family proton-dependent oligopeptide transporter